MDNNEDYEINEDIKQKQLSEYINDDAGQKLTTNQGLKVSNTDESLKAGKRGPTLMEDFHFREKLTHFDHERIPERVVHARGFGAHGYFQVYEPMKEYTKAKFLQNPDVKTPVFVRFSTVVGSKGSADTVRDARGFATKFYTEEGNYDLVANNIPVFFIQDAMKFPDIVHCIKPEQNNDIPQASAAHDTFWDFVVNTPEITHMIMWLLSDRAIPRSFRMMEGFSVNTFKLVNEEGVARFVKFHWKPKLGVHSLVWDEAQKLAGKDPDFHRRDLWDAISNGDFPEFELGIQTIDEEDEFNFDFDVLDPTKIWPEEIVPVKIIGKMTLNRNVENFFAETEQVAFHPANVVPGIDFSNDPLLQGRLFSYLDTQLIRLGGPNFHEIPINRPVVPVHNNQREGYHRMMINKGNVSYSKNSLRDNCPYPDAEIGYKHNEEKIDGSKIRQRSESFSDHYSQSTLFWNSMSAEEKQHIIDAFHFEVGSVKDMAIKQRVVDLFNNVNHELAVQIAVGVGAVAPSNKMDNNITSSSPAVSQSNTIKDARTRKVAILAENGFSYSDISQVMDSLKSAGVSTEIVSKKLGTITSEEGNELKVGQNYLTTASVKYDAVYIPGGRESIGCISEHGAAKHFINEAFKHCKTIGATNEGIDMLMQCNIECGDNENDSKVTNKYGVVTLKNDSNLESFNNEFINSIANHRHWARQNINKYVPA